MLLFLCHAAGGSQTSVLHTQLPCDLSAHQEADIPSFHFIENSE